MDIEKEREAFENHLKKMGKTDNETFSKNEDDSYQMDIIHFGWKIWQADKAQAVPEGFVVVEKKLIKTLHEELLDHEPDSFVVIRDICELWEQAEAQEPAKAQAVPEWISVEDKLPEKGEMVYGYAAKHNYTCPVVFNGKKFYNEGLADNSISHWHYLAKPMKVQEPTND